MKYSMVGIMRVCSLNTGIKTKCFDVFFSFEYENFKSLFFKNKMVFINLIKLMIDMIKINDTDIYRM
ncbi:hypothetical protein BB778_06900 [Pluralibacter gergoviae]|nr:hypothetical protein BB778_06900 [Pluralibacter gergoviae]